ncbi:MAG: ribonuclease HII [Bdellovibrio sp.]|nr:ribonuclease HII [Bdellovibrio sp.]
MGKKSAEPSLFPSLFYETQAGFPYIRVGGADEVGRGCLAGPVVGAAVVLPLDVDFKKHPWLKEVRDSKQVNEKTRAELAPLIQDWALAYCVGVASVAEIDQLNIYHASHLAIRRAVEGLKIRPEHLLVDGNTIPPQLLVNATAIVKGDSHCLSIAAASIIAKVWRDQKMVELDQLYPGYEFEKNKGYPTPAHKKILGKMGLTEHHRRSFKPVADLINS